MSTLLSNKGAHRHVMVALILAFLIGSLGAAFVHADSSDFLTVVGIVESFEKDTLKITSADNKSKKIIEVKVTGTSNFHLLAPQVRSGKTVITQRVAESTDLEAGQSIAVIYTVADKENVLLTAVMKPIAKDKK